MGGSQLLCAQSPYPLFGDSPRFFFEKSPNRLGQSGFSRPELNLELNDTGAGKDCS